MVRVVAAALMLLASCCTNVIFLEHLIKASSDSGSLLLFLQFSFIAIEGFVVARNFGRNPRHIPLRSYTKMVVLFFLSSATNNMALSFNIPMPLHMIFKSGSLVANLLLGSFLLRRSYPLAKYISVIMVSVGIFICTLITSLEAAQHNSEKDGSGKIMSVLVGSVLLCLSLLLSARLGIFQETLFLTHGKHPREALFYNHALPLPLFIALAPSILQNISFFSRSESLPVPIISGLLTTVNGAISIPVFVDFRIPILWQYAIVNMVTQYFCIRSVFYLASECTSLTVTMVVTLRKFVSLIFSVLYFRNNFTFYHCVGTFMVFLGTLIYANTFDLQAIFRKHHVRPVTKNGVQNGFHANEKKVD